MGIMVPIFWTTFEDFQCSDQASTFAQESGQILRAIWNNHSTIMVIFVDIVQIELCDFLYGYPFTFIA
jgi:hypothetical protein